MENKWTKINLGCGRLTIGREFCNIDIMPFTDNSGNVLVDIVMNVEDTPFPFEDNCMDEVLADNVFEHLGNGFIFALNECHRVLKESGTLIGVVPIANTEADLMDITHKRKFIKKSFGYICGKGLARPDRPSHPKYADYGVLPWNQIELKEEGNLIHFKLSPRKVNTESDYLVAIYTKK